MASGGAIQAPGSRSVRSRCARVLASTRVVLHPCRGDRLRGQRMRHEGGDAGIGEEVREPAPAEGGFERNLQWLVVQFSEHAQQLVRSSGDPPAEDRCPALIQGHDVPVLR